MVTLSKSLKITTHLWFDTEAKAAAKFYTAIFPKSKIISKSVLHNTPSGSVDIVEIELLGQRFTLISAGPFFKFNESISFIVNCKDQKEIDYFWKKLSADPKAEQCGWCKDKYGLSWQIVPIILQKMLKTKSPKKKKAVTESFLKMKKLNIAELHKAYQG